MRIVFAGARGIAAGRNAVFALEHARKGKHIRVARLPRGFADRGGTVLLSSHLLHEVQQVADRIVMIGNGRIVVDAAMEELLAEGTDLETLFLTSTMSTSREGIAA